MQSAPGGTYKESAMTISISRRHLIVAACLTGIMTWAAPSQAAPQSFKVTLTGAQQVPPV